MKESEPNSQFSRNELLEGAQLSLTRSQLRREYLRLAKRKSRASDPERYKRELIEDRERKRKNYSPERRRQYYQDNLEMMRLQNRERMRRVRNKKTVL